MTLYLKIQVLEDPWFQTEYCLSLQHCSPRQPAYIHNSSAYMALSSFFNSSLRPINFIYSVPFDSVYSELIAPILFSSVNIKCMKSSTNIVLTALPVLCMAHLLHSARRLPCSSNHIPNMPMVKKCIFHK